MQQPAPAEPAHQNEYKMRIFMRKLFLVFISSVLCLAASAQQSGNYEQRYNLLVSKLGPAGVGVETLLNNWDREDSTDVKMLTARFNYYLARSESQQVVTKSTNKYLGMDPILSLKDTTGQDVFYFQENIYDDELFGLAVKAADRAIRIHPDNLEFRFMKANAYIAYEKESPDMAIAYLFDLIKIDTGLGKPWKYAGKDADKDFFEDAMQEYCYSFYSIGSDKAMDAFNTLSQEMFRLHPDNFGFLNNIGTYKMVFQKDYKGALKCYDKVLKKKPEDYIAIRNGVLASRKLKDVKKEKKYLNMLIKHGPDADKRSAEVRLQALGKK